MFGWVILAIAIVCNILGNYFIKRFSLHAQIGGILDYLRPTLIAGMLFFGVGLLLYARALRKYRLRLPIRSWLALP
jgi:multidrug transporter EmrE-like cation transporter